MVLICAVVGCGNKPGLNGLSFYRFPAINLRFQEKIQALQRARRAAWIAALKREDLTEAKIPFTRVCSRHFLTGKPAELEDETNPDWVPSVHLGYTTKVGSRTLDRHLRLSKRNSKKVIVCAAPPENESYHVEEIEGADAESNTDLCVKDIGCQVSFQPVTQDIGVQTELTGAILNGLTKELQTVNQERYSLREKLKDLELSEESFRSNDSKTTFYTGLPTFAILLIIFRDVSPYISSTATSSLSKFQVLLLTLMKLRLNLKFVHLGYMFRVSNRTASRAFYQMLNILAIRLHHFVFWPDRDELRKTMPMCFQNTFGKSIAVIIDCFEISVERPSNLMARGQTWSSYKHHHTVKFLISICPQGVVSFISEGWGGRTSDKHITQQCGILNKLFPGDTVLADRGFNIEEDVALHFSTVRIPAFTKGKDQLDPKDVEETRKIASVRIHVERVIGTVRQKYQILSGPVPIEMLEGSAPVIDKVVHVCCALVNMSQSVVPFE